MGRMMDGPVEGHRQSESGVPAVGQSPSALPSRTQEIITAREGTEIGL